MWARSRPRAQETCIGSATRSGPPRGGTHGLGAPGPARAPLGPSLFGPARRGLRLLHAACGPAPAWPAPPLPPPPPPPPPPPRGERATGGA
ncbi:WAS/WASL-interacting protein family member 3-like [Theropithecus gelada]|uniref:WAS/WASL-interacting protein family member 3-like n=1 Tax=Theropithecus gelada TaxID=9565 RepID=UPI000DC16304|nr:WAS/WASL-interacting protein family member 3-like [Theropithecus gelada]